jgi:hypothetical protein
VAFNSTSAVSNDGKSGRAQLPPVPRSRTTQLLHWSAEVLATAMVPLGTEIPIIALEQLSSRISVPVDVPFVPPTAAQPEDCVQASVKFESTARPIIPVADAAAPPWFATPKIDTPFPIFPVRIVTLEYAAATVRLFVVADAAPVVAATARTAIPQPEFVVCTVTLLRHR